MLKIRLAVRADIDGIMEVERETFGGIGKDAMASRETILERIRICNTHPSKWFWIAEHEGQIVGYVIWQPTYLSSEQCTSWSVATDEGTLQRTFDEAGENVYGVSLAVCKRSPPGIAELLCHTEFVQWQETGKKILMLCSRIPGFAEAHRETGIDVEEYWQLTNKNGSPKDPMLHLYWRFTGGGRPFSLLKNGFPPDEDSGGHGVLFVADDVSAALRGVVRNLYQECIEIGRQEVVEQRVSQRRGQ